ncbi:MAG TPA: C45 family peptidase [Gemmataceae bacterium]|nr:C45 family peptidase [Gemmataceae bacterium]
MIRPRLLLVALVASAPLSAAAPSSSSSAEKDEPFHYPCCKLADGAELNYVNDLPVLTVSGSPEQIGAAVGSLALKPSARILSYTRDLLRADGIEFTWPLFVANGKGMAKHIPAEYRAEMDAIAKASGADPDVVTVANTFFDLKNTFECSALLIEAPRSATGGVLFGRNLDYPSMGYIHQHTLVTVYRPTGKHAFVSVGFPGLVGVLSGMNDAGLCLAVLEVYDAKDGEPRYNGQGVPYALCHRRLLEDCTTIAEAKKVLESMPRTSLLNLAIADKTGTAVFEITPKQVVQRSSEQAVCTCTNHFCSAAVRPAAEDVPFNSVGRLHTLDKVRGGEAKLGVEDLHQQLHAVNQGVETLQTMVFEPANLRLHLAFGKMPASAGQLHELDLAPLFKGEMKKSD